MYKYIFKDCQGFVSGGFRLTYSSRETTKDKTSILNT